MLELAPVRFEIFKKTSHFRRVFAVKLVRRGEIQARISNDSQILDNLFLKKLSIWHYVCFVPERVS